jgi:hypothetical protein
MHSHSEDFWRQVFINELLNNKSQLSILAAAVTEKYDQKRRKNVLSSVSLKR